MVVLNITIPDRRRANEELQARAQVIEEKRTKEAHSKIDKLYSSAPFWLAGTEGMTAEDCAALEYAVNNADTKLKVYEKLSALHRAARQNRVKGILDVLLERMSDPAFLSQLGLEGMLNVGLFLTRMQEADATFVHQTIESGKRDKAIAAFSDRDKIEPSDERISSLKDKLESLPPDRREAVRRVVMQLTA